MKPKDLYEKTIVLYINVIEGGEIPAKPFKGLPLSFIGKEVLPKDSNGLVKTIKQRLTNELTIRKEKEKEIERMLNSINDLEEECSPNSSLVGYIHYFEQDNFGIRYAGRTEFREYEKLEEKIVDENGNIKDNYLKLINGHPSLEISFAVVATGGVSSGYKRGTF